MLREETQILLWKMNTMSTSVAGTRSTRSGASLSIVVLSVGSRADLEHAIEVMTPSIRRFGAQLVVARAEDGNTSPAFLLPDHPKAAVVRAPKGATRAQLCDVGMAAATGDIVALRDDSAVRDVTWLESYAHAVRAVEPPIETLVANHSDFSAHEPLQVQASVDAVRRHSTLTAIMSSEQEPARLSVPLTDRRADPKRVVAREG